MPGRYEFRVSALSAKLAKGGSVYLDLDVPDFRAAPVVIGGFAIGYAEGGRVPVAPLPQKTAPPVLPFPPSLDRVFSDVRHAARLLRGVRARGERARDPVDRSRRRRRPRRAIAVAVIRQRRSDPRRRVDPAGGLAPGAYVLRATLGDGAAKATRETGIAIK